MMQRDAPLPIPVITIPLYIEAHWLFPGPIRLRGEYLWSLPPNTVLLIEHDCHHSTITSEHLPIRLEPGMISHSPAMSVEVGHLSYNTALLLDRVARWKQVVKFNYLGYDKTSWPDTANEIT